MKRTGRKIVITLAVIAAGGFFFLKPKPGVRLKEDSKTEQKTEEEIKPFIGTLAVSVSTTGTVKPRNRLEVKPPINGRMEEILVEEGQRVNPGEILAWMSSTDRAALLDAARSSGEDALRDWQEVYKATPLISPITADVIVRAVEPGQTVTTNDAVLVLSDRLIIKAQVDETDVGRVKLGQKAQVTLDAYPAQEIEARVEHVSYESQLINNVTIYEVDLLPQTPPEVFRSGMSANIEIIENKKDNILLLPLSAVQMEEDKTFVLLRNKNGKKSTRIEIQTGLSNDEHLEVVSGMGPQDIVVVEKKGGGKLKRSSMGSNPFMPTPQRNRQAR